MSLGSVTIAARSALVRPSAVQASAQLAWPPDPRTPAGERYADRNRAQIPTARRFQSAAWAPRPSTTPNPAVVPNGVAQVPPTAGRATVGMAGAA